VEAEEHALSGGTGCKLVFAEGSKPSMGAFVVHVRVYAQRHQQVAVTQRRHGNPSSTCRTSSRVTGTAPRATGNPFLVADRFFDDEGMTALRIKRLMVLLKVLSSALASDLASE
jgi:hypothetical protein